MKHIYLISLGGLVLLMALFFIVATIQANNKYKFKKPAVEMLKEAATQHHFVDLDELKEMPDKDRIVLIDIRTPREYITSHISGAINIPFERLLDETNETLFRNDSRKILYGMNSVRANSAWMLLTQFGYENIAVLNGGITSEENKAGNDGPQATEIILDEKPAFDYADIMEKSTD